MKSVTIEINEEINKKWESYKRTEKALDEEYDCVIRKKKAFQIEIMDFIDQLTKDGYVHNHTFGWIKK